MNVSLFLFMTESFYSKNNILTIPLKIKVNNNKKQPFFPDKWNLIDSVQESNELFEKYKGYRSIALLTGKKNKITILDIDEPENWETVTEELGICYPDNGVIVETRRGYHLYYQYEEDLSTSQNIIQGIDIKNDNSNCTCPPSYYVLENGDKIDYTFRDGTLQENILKLKDLPKMPISLKNKLVSLKSSMKVVVKKQIKVKLNNLIDEKIYKVNKYLNKLTFDNLNNFQIVNKLIFYICQYSERSNVMLSYIKKKFSQCKYEDQIEYQWSNCNIISDVDKSFNTFRKFIRNLISDNLNTDTFDQDILIELIKKRYSLAIEYFNRHFGIIISNDNGKIMYCEKEYEHNSICNVILISSESNFVNKLPKSICVEIKDKPVVFTQYWIENIDRKTYRKIIFEPYTKFEQNKSHINDLNMYLGFKNQYDLSNDFQVNTEKIKFPLRHLREVLCDNNEVVFNYLLNWLAHIIQKPNQKMGIAVLCKSIQGVGKNLFFESFIGKRIIGKNHFVNIADSNQVVGQFNSILERMIFTIVNELKSDGNIIKMSNYMKALITDETQKIEKKGMDAVYTNNYNNFVFLTNNHNVVNIELQDRRYLCIEASSRYIKDIEYRTEMIEKLTSDDVALHFFHYLLQINIEDFDYRNIPITPYKKQLMINSIPQVITWFGNFVIEQMTPVTNKFDTIEIFLKDLFAKYKLESNGSNIKITTFKAYLLDDKDKSIQSIKRSVVENSIYLTINLMKTFEELKSKNYLIDLS